MPALTAFDELAALLARDRTRHVVDRAQQVIELPTDDPALPGDLLVRWEKQLPFIQLIHTVLVDIPPPRVLEIERAIVRLNNAIEMPGFGLDEDARRLYFRLVAPAFPPHGIDADVLYQLAQGTVKTATLYQPAFQAVVAGRPGGEIVALASAVMKAQR